MPSHHFWPRPLPALVPGTASADSQAFLNSFTAPEGKVYLLYGNEMIFRLSMKAAASVARGASLAVVDGGNRFDVHALSRYAQMWKMNPDLLLRRVFVSRGFTSYQMEAAVTDRLPAFLRQHGLRTAMVFGLLDTLYDDQVKFREAQQILIRMIGAFHGMKSDNVSLLVACPEVRVMPRERNRFLTVLKSGADRVFHLTATEDKIQMVCEQPSRSEQRVTGGISHGTDSTDVYRHHRERTRELVEVPARTPEG